MEVKQKLPDITAGLTQLLKTKKYKEACIKKFIHTWEHLERYMLKSGITSYSRDVGEAFIKGRFGDIPYRDLKKSKKDKVRHIQILSDYQENGIISRHRLKVPEITFAGGSPEMSYLTADAMKLLLRQPDISTRNGRRDLALLGLMYDSAARVQEIADLTPSDFRFEGTTTVRLKGKGSKSRIVPLSENQVRNLMRYMQENHLFEPHTSIYPLFGNSHNSKLSRAAILAIVKKYTVIARLKKPSIIPDKIGCHSLYGTLKRCTYYRLASISYTLEIFWAMYL